VQCSAVQCSAVQCSAVQWASRQQATKVAQLVEREPCTVQYNVFLGGKVLLQALFHCINIYFQEQQDIKQQVDSGHSIWAMPYRCC
jgi:hypothetical protein